MNTDEKKNSTLEYLESAEPGAIVAFHAIIKGVERTLSGKLTGKAEGADGARKAVIETKNGSMFTVGFNDIIWVKTGVRWPRWVFEELKKK